jgi:hypothetical protein
MWKEDYLLQLRTAHHVRNPLANDQLKHGEVVLIKDDKTPRLNWRLARVDQLIPGRDGRVRSAILRLSDGKHLRRAIEHICPLEVR